MDAASRKAGAVARNDGDATGDIAKAKRRVEAVYQMPFLAHATMEPINCTVDLKPDGCDVYVGTQVPVFAQAAVAKPTGRLGTTNQGVVGSNRASRAGNQSLGEQNQVLHATAEPLWDLKSCSGPSGAEAECFEGVLRVVPARGDLALRPVRLGLA